MIVREILSEWLKEHHYDGLFFDDCGCPLCDLIPCGNDPSLCEPGVKKLQDDGDWIIVPAEALRE